MDKSLKQLKERAIVEITNKIVNNMTMSEVMEVVIRYSEQTAKKAVDGLDRQRLEQITGEGLTIDKNIKRKPIRQDTGRARKSAEPSPKEKSNWLSFFNKEKKQHRGWNRKREKEESILTKIKKFFNLDE